jgi:hypothetical protein
MDVEHAALARGFLRKGPHRVDDVGGDRGRRQKRGAAVNLKARQVHARSPNVTTSASRRVTAGFFDVTMEGEAESFSNRFAIRKITPELQAKQRTRPTCTTFPAMALHRRAPVFWLYFQYFRDDERRESVQKPLWTGRISDSGSEIAVQNVEKPSFLAGFRHIVPVPESMEQPWLPKCRSRS